MKFILTKGEKLTPVLERKKLTVSGCSMTLPTTFHRVGLDTETPSSKPFLKEMMKRVVNKCTANPSKDDSYLSKPLFDEVEVIFGWKDDYNRFTVAVEGWTLKVLRDIFTDGVEIRVKLSQADIISYSSATNNEDVFSKGMRVEDLSDPTKGGFCVDDNLSIPKAWQSYLLSKNMHNSHFCAKVSVEVSIPDVEMRQPGPGASSEDIVLSVTKKMLEQGTHSDMVIVPGTGSQVKCHKSFLAAHSIVFAAMLRNKWKESSEKKIEMRDMSEEAVKAFLGYLYCGELTPAYESSQMAFQMFEVAHKYQVVSLEEDAKRILLHKPAEWYDVNVALRIFALYEHLKRFEDLRTKALQVMKEKYKELEECVEYKQLFAKDPKGAMRLCKYAFSV